MPRLVIAAGTTLAAFMAVVGLGAAQTSTATPTATGTPVATVTATATMTAMTPTPTAAATMSPTATATAPATSGGPTRTCEACPPGTEAPIPAGTGNAGPAEASPGSRGGAIVAVVAASAVLGARLVTRKPVRRDARA